MRDNVRRRLDDTELGHKKLTQRLLQDKTKPSSTAEKAEEIDEFDFEQRPHEVDIFLGGQESEELSDAMLNEVLEIQNAFNSENKGDAQKLVLKLFAERFTPEIPDIDSDDVFSTAPSEKINITKFASRFEFAGISLDNTVSHMKWNVGFDKLTAILASGENPDSGAEAIDPDVLNAINSAGEREIERFHSDNFAQFDDLQESDFISDVKFGLEEDQILLLERDIVDETYAYGFLVKSFGDKNQADQLWKDIITKKQKLAVLVDARNKAADPRATKTATTNPTTTATTTSKTSGTQTATRRKLIGKRKSVQKKKHGKRHRRHAKAKHHKRAHHARRHHRRAHAKRHHKI